MPLRSGGLGETQRVLWHLVASAAIAFVFCLFFPTIVFNGPFEVVEHLVGDDYITTENLYM